MDKNELKEIRRQKFAQMEQQLKEMHPKEEDSLFYYHSSEDRIVLSGRSEGQVIDFPKR
jgi:DNA-binding TFAR19-related protein (PDSD5 family)